jgi:hypothetical protein
MTHDQSFLGPSGSSVNSRVNHSKLPPCMYGYCLRRIIHYILGLRQRNQATKIFINNFDYDAAYRRCHLAAKSAQESLTIHGNFLYMALCLTFGGSPCPNLWNCISETGTDIANMLIQNQFWDHKSIYDNLSTTIQDPESLPDDIAFAQTKELAVNIPTNDIGKADIYIDDTIGVALDKNDNVKRVSAAIPLAIHILSDIYIDDTIGVALDKNDNVKRVSAAIPLAIHILSRPLDSLDDIPRKEIISLKKFLAKGRPSKTKTVLGWVLNTRTL